MSLHKLSAGSGYEYLTRQVAALDSTEKGCTPLTDYYSAKGESPGRWAGSGLVGIDGLESGDVVTAQQMKLLFGTGRDPVTGADLGRRYAVYSNDGVDGFNVEVARRVEAKPNQDVAEIRSEVGKEFFLRRHGREPRNARELAGAVTRFARPRQSAVAGFDLTFSPVKSVSTLWAVAPREVADAIEASHEAAVTDALTFIEREVLFTREGKDGARQVETRGLLAAAFTHRDSRAGDPDLHTHVAVANKVQTREGKWLAIFGKSLHEQAVSISETYNTALEAHLGERLGIRFAERSKGSGRRPVREVVGVDPQLCDAWSARRAAIVTRQQELAHEFQETQGRPPTRCEEYALAQQANLETRAAKHEPRSQAEQRATWRAEATGVLGSETHVAEMMQAALQPPPLVREHVSTGWVHAAADRVVAEVEARRATWQGWHVRAEAQRQIRNAAIPASRVAEVVEWVVDDALERLSVNLTPDLDPVPEPATLRRSNGTSVYRHVGSDHYTSHRILEAEQRIMAAAGRDQAMPWSPLDVEITVLAAGLGGIPLNCGQERLVQTLATSGRQVQLALAPAGSGKTTAMRVLAEVWREAQLNAVGLAPSAAAAAALREATGIRCDTLAKFVHDLTHRHDSELLAAIGPGSLLVIDEVGMADTLTLAAVIDHAVAKGAAVRLIGDDQQLAAIGAGGVLRDIATTHGAVRLDEVVRFSDPSEAEASLRLREGDRTALGFYLDHDRIHVGDSDSCLDAALNAWQQDLSAGRDCLMLAPTRDLVRDLNRRARAAILDGAQPSVEVPLVDGNVASVGDVIITRHNDRRLGVSATDWVKNGDRWTITGIRDGALDARHTGSGLRTTLPASYVAAHVELGYASTVHTAQGLTADVMHGIVTGDESRQVLYTMMTRGRHANHAHLIVSAGSDTEQLALPGIAEELTATETLERILAHDGTTTSVTTTTVLAGSPAARLHDAAIRYADALAHGTARVPGAADETAVEGPLPWLSAIPEAVTEHPTWSRYLETRARLVTDLAGKVRAGVAAEPPEWARKYDDTLTPDFVAEIAVWRAASGINTEGGPLLGPPASGEQEAFYQRRLVRRLNARYAEVLTGWEDRVVDRVGHRDERTIELAKVLEQLSRRGIDAEQVLDRAVAHRPLPDDHATAALEFRVRQLVRPTHPKKRTRPNRETGIDPSRRPDPPNAGHGIGL